MIYSILSLIQSIPLIRTAFAQDADTATEQFLINVAEESGAYAETYADDLPVVIGRIINVALTLLGAVFLILILYGGFTWMTAGGDSEKIKKAQGILKNSVIGLIIVLAAYAISAFVVTGIVEATRV